MTEPDPLPEIKTRLRQAREGQLFYGPPSSVTDIEWLVGQVEEWRQAAEAEADLADERGREVERLRGLLARLETAIDMRLQGLEGKPHLPYRADAAAAYADVRKMLRDPDWLAARLQRPDLPGSPR
jgi:hypothetical protein